MLDGLTGPYRVAPETIENQLNELVSSGKAFSFEPYVSKAPRYWSYDQEHYARQLVLKNVSRHPKTWSEVKSALKKPLKGFPDARLSKLQKDMLDGGVLHKLPPFEPAEETRVPAPVESHSDEESLESRILERMVEVVPAAVNGALVSLRDLRRSMDFQNVDKSAFDQAVLRLADQGKVALHRHDFPAGLSTEDRAELVTDATGDFYVGIALRQ